MGGVWRSARACTRGREKHHQPGSRTAPLVLSPGPQGKGPAIVHTRATKGGSGGPAGMGAGCAIPLTVAPGAAVPVPGGAGGRWEARGCCHADAIPLPFLTEAPWH
ncbi:unnamed protein product [Discosporangium mesarthrocarpum]